MLFSDRGNPVTGLADPSDDGQPLTLLTYANGPGFGPYLSTEEGGKVTRQRLWGLDGTRGDVVYPSAAWKKSATHGGEDVPIYAVGPMAHLFHSTHDQTHIANVMAYSACIGAYADDFDPRCR